MLMLGEKCIKFFKLVEAAAKITIEGTKDTDEATDEKLDLLLGQFSNEELAALGAVQVGFVEMVQALPIQQTLAERIKRDLIETKTLGSFEYLVNLMLSQDQSKMETAFLSAMEKLNA